MIVLAPALHLTVVENRAGVQLACGDAPLLVLHRGGAALVRVGRDRHGLRAHDRDRGDEERGGENEERLAHHYSSHTSSAGGSGTPSLILTASQMRSEMQSCPFSLGYRPMLRVNWKAV